MAAQPIPAEPHGVTALIEGPAGQRYHGAAVLRTRAHPVSGALLPQLGVPDDALGFRPVTGGVYRLELEEPAGERATFSSDAAWLDRIGSSWWFILRQAGDPVR